MTQFIFATGMDELDRALTEHVKQMGYQVESVGYLQGLTVVPTSAGDVVLLSDAVPMSGAGLKSAVDIVDRLRRKGVRVIFIGANRPEHDRLIPEFISRGVYDILLSDDLLLTDILDRIRVPAEYADVADWMMGASASQDVNRPALSQKTSLTWRKEPAVEEPKQDISEGIQRPEQSERRLLKWPTRESKQKPKKVEQRIITVTGLPGSGVSFIALHLAATFSERYRVTLIEASRRPTYAHWLNGPRQDRGAQQLAGRKVIERRWMYTDNLRILPSHPEEAGPYVVLVREAAKELDSDVVIIDAALEDVRKESGDVDVLVVPPDVVKTRHVRDIHTRFVVVNMAPPLLPVDLAEYGRLWSPVSVTTCPYMAEQALSVVTGELVGMNDVMQEWPHILVGEL